MLDGETGIRFVGFAACNVPCLVREVYLVNKAGDRILVYTVEHPGAEIIRRSAVLDEERRVTSSGRAYGEYHFPIRPLICSRKRNPPRWRFP